LPRAKIYLDMKKKNDISEWREACRDGYQKVISHPVFAGFSNHAHFLIDGQYAKCPTNLPLTVDQYGYVFARPQKDWTEDIWAYNIAICFIHLGFDHFKHYSDDPYFHAASFIEASRFLNGIKFISATAQSEIPDHIPKKNLANLLPWLKDQSTKEEVLSFTQYPFQSSGFCMLADKLPFQLFKPVDFPVVFSEGIQYAIDVSLDVAAGRRSDITSKITKHQSKGDKARSWLLANYPLLSGLAAYFELVESVDICRSLGVAVGMIDVGNKKVYINPLAGLNDDEYIWVLAHEYLHAGLNHCARMDEREPYIWNVACDFAINSWLEQLRIGQRPQIGVMFDTEFNGWSAERIYDHLTQHMRVLRKWVTLSGEGVLDMRGKSGIDTDGDKFCRDALCQGYFRHQQKNRGDLPYELIESIKALDQPVIPWDVMLGRWFTLHITMQEKKRTYTRPSRRQESSPDTPMPRSFLASYDQENAHTFGVILDTSGSMSKTLLAKCLGTIAQYAIAHEVPAVRLVFCDARPYDAGYVRPDDLLYQEVNVVGRGGTVLQNSIKLLESDNSFPIDAPILILTDGETDVLDVRRTHAFVLPKNHRLPFSPAGDVFYIN
jgi:predicted metal-dependent peptidase